MSARLDLIGKKFGRLTVIDFAYMKNTNSYWRCKCECNNETVVAGNNLNRGHTKSCGCLQKEKARSAKMTHGHILNGITPPEYRIWRHMISRCENPNTDFYQYYGGRGITVCDEWRNSFETFLNDMGRRPSPKHSIDRIDNDKGYYPENCRWATSSEQILNQGLRRTNTTGVKGVRWSKNEKKYKTDITINKKRIHLGTFATLEEAATKRRQAEKDLIK